MAEDSPRRDISGLTPVLGGKQSDMVHWVMRWSTEHAYSEERNMWQLRSEPVYINVSPKCVFDTSIGAWMKKHRARYVVVSLFALQAVMRIRGPRAELIEMTFDGVVHEMHQKSYLWFLLDIFVNSALVFILLHYTNRDLLRKQVFAFDTLAIVGNYFAWYCTRAFSEYSVFHDVFDFNRAAKHAVETFAFLPLTVVIACFDSVKMPHKTKVAIVAWMIVERMLQYYRYAVGDTVFANHGYCPAFGIDFECANVRGSHLSSNMTVIIFLLKSLRVYAMGGHFAVIKPTFRMVVRLESQGLDSMAIGRNLSEANDDGEDTDNKDCGPKDTAAQGDGTLDDQYEVRMCRSPPASSETSTPRPDAGCPKPGAGPGAGVLAVPAVQEGCLHVPEFELAKPISDSEPKCDGACAAIPPRSPEGDMEASDSRTDSSGGGMFRDLRCALRDMELAAGSLREKCRGTALPDETPTPKSGDRALVVDAPISHPDQVHEDPLADRVRGLVPIRGSPPRGEEQALTPPGRSESSGKSPLSLRSADIVSLQRARDETRKLCRAYERDLDIFRMQLNLLETQIAEFLQPSDCHPGFERPEDEFGAQ